MATLGHIRGRGPLDTSSCETGTQETVGGMEQPEVAEGSGPPAPARQLAGSVGKRREAVGYCRETLRTWRMARIWETTLSSSRLEGTESFIVIS